MVPVVVFMVFLVLKLTGVVAWGWVWVTAPLWLPFALFFVALTVMMPFVAVLGTPWR